MHIYGAITIDSPLKCVFIFVKKKFFFLCLTSSLPSSKHPKIDSWYYPSFIHTPCGLGVVHRVTWEPNQWAMTILYLPIQ